MDNQNKNTEQNGYTNFNNYQPPTDNQSPDAPQTDSAPQQQADPYQQAPQGNPYQQTNPYQQAPYQQAPYQVANQAKENKGLVCGIISIVLSLISCCGCSIFTSFPGAIFGLIGVIRNKKSVVSWIGLIVCVLLTVGWLCYLVYAFTHPEFMREIFEESGMYDQETIDEMMSLFEFMILNRM